MEYMKILFNIFKFIKTNHSRIIQIVHKPLISFYF